MEARAARAAQGAGAHSTNASRRGILSRTPDPDASAQYASTHRDPLELAWRFLASRQVAVGLIIALTAASLAGTILLQVPEGVSPGSPAYADWLNRIRPKYGSLTDLLNSLQAFYIFSAGWFRLLVGVLALNITVCTLNRFGSVWRLVTHPPIKRADAFFAARDGAAQERFDGVAAQELAQAAKVCLKSHGYRVVAETTGRTTHLYGDKNAFAPFGTFANHAGLVLILLGAVSGGFLGGFRDKAFVVPVGSTRDVGHSTELALYVEDFADEYHPSGRPKDYRSEVVLYQRSREVARQTIRVNDPLEYNGVRFHQSFFGQAAVVSVRDRDGRSLFGDAVALAWRSNDGERPVGSFLLSEQGLNVYLVGTAGQGDPVVAPGQLVLEAYAAGAELPTYRATLNQGQTQTVAGLQFTFEREKQFTGLQVVRDQGSFLVWIGGALMVLGLTFAFYFPHRRMWALCTQDDAGSRLAIALGGTHSGSDTVLRGILQGVVTLLDKEGGRERQGAAAVGGGSR